MASTRAPIASRIASSRFDSDVTLVSSAYAIDEAERNLDSPDRRVRLYRLLQQIEIVDEPPATVFLPKRVALTAKDQPILRAAIHAKLQPSPDRRSSASRHFVRAIRQGCSRCNRPRVLDWSTSPGRIALAEAQGAHPRS